MQKRYFIEHSSKVSNAGVNPIRLGLPIGLHTVNDICICCKGSSEFIPLNAIILREALLENPEKIKQFLGIEVKDVLIKASEQKEVVEKTKEIKKEAKKK